MWANNEWASVLFHHEELEEVYYTPKKYKILQENYKELTQLLGAYFDDNFFKKLNHQDQIWMVSTIETNYGDQITELLTTHCTETKPLLTNERTSKNFKRIIDRYRTARPSLGQGYCVNLGTSRRTVYAYFYNGRQFMEAFGSRLKQKKYLLEEFGTLADIIKNTLNIPVDEKKLCIICNDIDEEYLYVTIAVEAEHMQFQASYSLDVPIDDCKLFMDIFLAPELGYSDLFIPDDETEEYKNKNEANGLISDFNNDQQDDDEDEEYI